MASIDIIIVNWNTGKQLIDCLHSISTAKQAMNNVLLNSVIIVDNASSDSSLDGIHNFVLPLELIINDYNKGFAAACNQGATYSLSDYLLFLNPDTILHENSLIASIEFMENKKNQHVGICGIKLLDDNGSVNISCARFPTSRILVGKITGLSKIFPKLFPAHFISSEELQQSREVDQVIGAFFLVRRKVFEELNGFDERFFVYYEEVDFSLRAKQAGYSSYYLANASAYHKGGGSSRQIKSTRLFYSLRSRLQYAYKHYSKFDLIILVILTVPVEIILRMLKAIFHASWSNLLEVLDAYKLLVVSLVKRRWTQ